MEVQQQLEPRPRHDSAGCAHSKQTAKRKVVGYVCMWHLQEPRQQHAVLLCSVCLLVHYSCVLGSTHVG